MTTDTTASEQGSRRAFLCLSHSPFMTLPGRENDGAEYRAAVDRAREFIAGFAPDIVVMFAPDHMHLLNDIRPPFTGVLSGRTVQEFDTTAGELSGHPAAADLFRDLVQHDVDLAVGEDIGVDHGLSLTVRQLFDDPASAPLIPIIVNAIGFPLFPVRRAATVGERIGAALAERPERILFVGTGGLSHNPPFPEPAPGAKRLSPEQREESLANALSFVDPDWDRRLIDLLAAGDLDTFAAITQPDIDPRGGGANEIRTWAAAWAAAGGGPATFTAYETVRPWITGMGVAFGPGRVPATAGAAA